MNNKYKHCTATRTNFWCDAIGSNRSRVLSRPFYGLKVNNEVL